MCPAPPGDLLFSQHGHPDARRNKALVDANRDDGRPRVGQGLQAIEYQTVLGQGPGDAIGCRFAVHGNHHFDPPSKQAVQPDGNRLGITGNRIEGSDLEHRIRRPGGTRGQTQILAPREALFEIEEERGMLARLGRLLTPRGSQCRRQLGLLLDQVTRPVQGATRLDQHQMGIGWKCVEEGKWLGQPGQP